jgi:hypothetical protein
MDWWSVAKIFWAVIAMGAAATTLLILLRARGTLNWRKSLTAELKALAESAVAADPSYQKAVAVVEDRCRRILNSVSPEFGEVQALPQYIQAIAACFHPQVQRPELQVTVAAFIHSLEKSLERFDCILARPALRKLRAIRIRHIKQALQWYQRISAYRLYRWYARYQSELRQIRQLRLLLYLDPFMGIAYLSNQLTLLIWVKYLLVDLYLYFGRLALAAFGKQTPSLTDEESLKEDLEETLEALDAAALQEDNATEMDPDIRRIRERFIGFAAVVSATPTFADWKTAVREAAGVIAARHFPDCANPIEEAAIGALLERSRFWIAGLSKGEEYLIARRFYQLRLDTLYRSKDLANFVLPGLLRRFAKKAYLTYGWLKWPLKVYRWARKTGAWGIALEIGWLAGKKATLAHIYGKTFDRTCRELEIVYRRSRQPGK